MGPAPMPAVIRTHAGGAARNTSIRASHGSTGLFSALLQLVAGIGGTTHAPPRRPAPRGAPPGSRRGQRNRFSGDVLDAEQAREIPAPAARKRTAARKTGKPASTSNPAGACVVVAVELLDVVSSKLCARAQHSNDGSRADSAGSVACHNENADRSKAVVRETPLHFARDARNADAPVLYQQRQRRSEDVDGPPSAPVAHDAPTRRGAKPDLLTRMLARAAVAGAKMRTGPRPLAASSQLPISKPLHRALQALQQPQPFASAIAAVTAPSTASNSPAIHVAAPAPHVPVDARAVLEQVVRGIVVRDLGATSEVRIRLQPEHLGEVALKLTVSNGTLSAGVVAANGDVRSILLANQSALARSLAQAGIALGAFSVNVSGGNSSGQQQRQFSPPQQRVTIAVASPIDAGAPEARVLNALA